MNVTNYNWLEFILPFRVHDGIIIMQCEPYLKISSISNSASNCRHDLYCCTKPWYYLQTLPVKGSFTLSGYIHVHAICSYYIRKLLKYVAVCLVPLSSL